MMDDTTLERGLRARPPADPIYLSRITATPPTVLHPAAIHVRRRATARHPQRFQTMNATLKIAILAVLILAAGIGVVLLRPSSNSVGSDVSPSPSPSPLVWSPATIEQDWPAPVREEPVGDPVIISFAYGTLDYLDPQGDIESPETPWIDIVRAEQGGCSNPDGVCVGLAAGVPPGLAVPGDPWIAYGLVFDTDLDGVADVRLGLDRIPADMAVDRQLIPARGDAAKGDNVTRGWKTDLRTGATEIGVAGDWICQCGFPIEDPDERGGDAQGFMKLYPGSYPTDNHADDRFSLIPGRFYVWASEIQDGRVVATDYAPDTGWLKVSGPADGP